MVIGLDQTRENARSRLQSSAVVIAMFCAMKTKKRPSFEGRFLFTLR
jgi:hypothetical protein